MEPHAYGHPFLKYPDDCWQLGPVHLRGWASVTQLEMAPYTAVGQGICAQVTHPGTASSSVSEERHRVKRDSPLTLVRQLAALASQQGLHLVAMLTFEAAHIQEDLPAPQEPFLHFLLCDATKVSAAELKAQWAHAVTSPRYTLVQDSSPQFFKNFEASKQNLLNGDVFEIVLSRRMGFLASENPLPALIHALHTFNAPYQFFVPFLDRSLVGATPELLVEVTGRQVRTRPISGSVRRRRMGEGLQLTDADRVALSELLASEKEKSELDMLIDLSRHDLHRVCRHVQVSAYREALVMDSIIHTQATVTGELLDDFSAIDAFFSCLNAGTLVGAPKRKAMEIISQLEEQPRGFYGGNLLHIVPNQGLRSLILIRTIEVQENKVYMQAGATVLLGADPRYEYWECGSKIRPWLQAVGHEHLCGDQQVPPAVVQAPIPAGTEDLLLKTCYPVAVPVVKNHAPVRLLLLDNEDSFTFNLEALFRSLGTLVDVVRNRMPIPDLSCYQGVVLSPGPSAPKDAGFLLDYVKLCAGKIPLFGVCLGFQAMVEALGGTLGRMAQPLHGKCRQVLRTQHPDRYLKGCPDPFVAARYHSLYAESIPALLRVTAVDDQGIPMAIEATSVDWPPFLGVQFHPESFLTGPVGRVIADNWLKDVCGEAR